MNRDVCNALMELSPYDESLPLHILQEAFNFRIDESQVVTERIYRDVVIETEQSFIKPVEGEEKVRLTVDTSDEMMQDYKNGVIKLAKENGHLVAQIREKGRYGQKLPIKEEKYIDGPDSLEIQNAVQLQAIQKSLTKISEQISAIDDSVKRISSELQNDRLGLYYSGVALFIESCSVKDSELRKQLIAQSVKSLTDAAFQLTLELKSDIQYLKRKEYNREKKNKYNSMNEKVAAINDAFIAIHQATIMKSAIYCQQGEIVAMLLTLAEYEQFINGTIAQNAEMLSQCTAGDTGTISGIWKTRANLRLDISNVTKMLQISDAPLYIECEGVYSNESD